MRSTSIPSFHISFAFVILLSHFANSLITSTSSLRPSRFMLSACISNQPATTFPRFLTSFRSISSVMRRSSSSSTTSRQATPIGGGAYQEVPQEELLKGVLDRPVLQQRPEKLRNKYFGLRHGKRMVWCRGSGILEMNYPSYQ